MKNTITQLNDDCCVCGVDQTMDSKLAFGLLLLVFFILMNISPITAQAVWTAPILIDSAGVVPTRYYGSALALDDSGNVYATFSSSRSESIFVANSTNGGDTWTKHGYVDAAETLRIPQGIAIDHLGNVWLLIFTPEFGHKVSD